MILWRCRWGLVRLALAGFLLWVVAADTGARLARLQLASLPGFDHVSEVRSLRLAGRYGEALVIADAGLDSGDPAQRAGIEAERRLVVDEQGSVLRRATDVGLGALSGQGGSLEQLVGAVAADFFVVGDVRDLVIQGGKYVADGEADPVIAALSAVGLATTLAPGIDWVPSFLKIARKTGAMTRAMGEFIVEAAKSRRFEALGALMSDVRRLASKASPAGAIRLLRHADSPEDVAKLAGFVERNKAGAFALHVTGDDGVRLVKAGADDAGIIAAAGKGASGAAWLRTGAYRAMLRPHPLVGLAKALWKGNAQALVARIAAAIDPRAWWLVPLLATWAFVECGLLVRAGLGKRAQTAEMAKSKWQMANQGHAAAASARRKVG